LVKTAFSTLGKVDLSQKPVRDKDHVPITKADDELQIVWGEVYAPGYPDTQGDFATPETVREMAYGFMRKNALHSVDLHHSREDCGATIVESFVARDDDPIFLPGAWVIGVHIPCQETWALVKNGDLNGFSLDGLGIRVPTNLEIDLPELLKGETTSTNDHKHMFEVKFSDEGSFLGGWTNEVNGHKHQILKGTVTEEANGHTHRFSWVDGILRVIEHEGEG
jgi:hypothetical protein